MVKHLKRRCLTYYGGFVLVFFRTIVDLNIWTISALNLHGADRQSICSCLNCPLIHISIKILRHHRSRIMIILVLCNTIEATITLYLQNEQTRFEIVLYIHNYFRMNIVFFQFFLVLCSTNCCLDLIRKMFLSTALFNTFILMPCSSNFLYNLVSIRSTNANNTKNIIHLIDHDFKNCKLANLVFV